MLEQYSTNYCICQEDIAFFRGSGGCFMGRWVFAVPVPGGGGLPFLSPADPAFCFSFCPLSPTPLPRRGRGRPRLFHARGSAPCIPGAEPTRHLHDQRFLFVYGGAVPAAKERGDRGRGTSAFEMVLSPGAGIANAAGGLPFLSPACPAFSLLFCPPSPKGKDIPPPPLPQRGRGRFKVISCKGLRPLHPRGRTHAALGKGANHAPGGGLAPGVAG